MVENRYTKAAKSTLKKHNSKGKDWIKGAVDPAKKGEFTAKAKRAGYTKEDGSGDAQAFAKHVLANKGDYDAETVDQAQFALNMGKMAKKKDE